MTTRETIVGVFLGLMLVGGIFFFQLYWIFPVLIIAYAIYHAMQKHEESKIQAK